MNRITLTLLCWISSLCLIAQSINQAQINSLLEKAEASHSEAVIIYQDNQLISENYFGLGHRDSLTETMSCTKSIVGLAAVCLLDDGLLDSLSTPVHHFYPEWKQGQKQTITIEHLLTMTSGLQNHPNASLEIYPSPDFVQLALTAELSTPPGETFSYNNKALNLMAGVFQKVTGKRMDVYIAERLFAPLEITVYNWSLDDAGNPHVMSGCQIRPIDFAKFGHLLLHRGQYDGQQVISVQNIEKVIQPNQQYQGYGLLWWLDYESITYIVDDALINDLKENNVTPEFITKMEALKGTYNSFPVFEKKILAVFGPNPWDYIISEASDFSAFRRKVLTEPIISYNANGYLGNYLYVIPEKNIVAVRMTSHKSYDRNDPTNKDTFNTFGEMVHALTD